MTHRDSYWSYVSNSYWETEDDLDQKIHGDIATMIYIDAWKTNDGNEEGKTVARVVKTKSGDVYVIYQDSIAEHDKCAQEIIQESIAELRRLA